MLKQKESENKNKSTVLTMEGTVVTQGLILGTVLFNLFLNYLELGVSTVRMIINDSEW